MKTITFAAIALSLLAVGASAQTPGYDRPSTEQTKEGGKAKLVYWTTYFERFHNDPQTMADSYTTDTLTFLDEKPKKVTSDNAKKP